MSKHTVKNFFSKIFGLKEKHPVSCDCSVHQGLNDIEKTFKEINQDFPSVKESIKILLNHPRIMSKFDRIEERIIEISDFTTTPEFADMVVNRPDEVRKLRDELDALVSAANNL